MIIPDEIAPLDVTGEKSKELKKKVNELAHAVNVLTNIMRGITVSKDPVVPYTREDKMNKMTVGTSVRTATPEQLEDAEVPEGTVKDASFSDKVVLVKQKRGWTTLLRSALEKDEA